MHISATIRNSTDKLETIVQTNDNVKNISVPAKVNGQGSAVNGGELLLLSIATCFCNDLYREAAKRSIKIQEVEVIASGEFGAEGEPGFNFQYRTKIVADVCDEEIKSLVEHTDKVAEVHNTLRKGLRIVVS